MVLNIRVAGITASARRQSSSFPSAATYTLYGSNAHEKRKTDSTQIFNVIDENPHESLKEKRSRINREQEQLRLENISELENQP